MIGCELDPAWQRRKRIEDAGYCERRDHHRASWRRPDPQIAAEVEAAWLRWVGGAS